MNPGETPKPIDTNIQGKLPPLNTQFSAQPLNSGHESAPAPRDFARSSDGANESQPIGAWLNRNLTWLLLGAAVIGVLTYTMGSQWVFNALELAVGLGLIIFVHELGHFAVAKLCDVHVQTFSIGFGPALPGCSFRKGETLYKLAIFPLGGYVKMVGEGSESEEGDDDPRSFKNKSVGQRMAIISAGVVMNILMACVCFIIAYESGVERMAAVISTTDAGSPAWTKGVRTGAVVRKVGDRENPVYEDLMITVVLSDADKKVPFVFQEPGGKPYELLIEPKREEGDYRPAIGVTSASTTKLFSKKAVGEHPTPYLRNSPAAAARELDLGPNDIVLATTDPDHPEQMLKLMPAMEIQVQQMVLGFFLGQIGHKNWNLGCDLIIDLSICPSIILDNEPMSASDYRELGKRMLRFAGKPMTMVVQRNRKTRELDVPAEGFHFEDEVIGTTADGQSNPFVLKELPVDEFRDPENHGRDYFEYRRRLNRLAGNPVVLQVNRPGDETPHLIFMPQTFQYTLPGVRMGMGRVTALRDGSACGKAGVQLQDTLQEIELVDKNNPKQRVRFTNAPNKGGDDVEVRALDPARLPSDLHRWATGRSAVEAKITVLRTKDHEEGAPEVLPPVEWDFSWQDDNEVPLKIRSPMAIPELGIAYQIQTTVEAIAEKSPVREAGLQEGDVIMEVAFQKTAKAGADPEWAKEPTELWTEQKSDASGDKRKPEAWWAHVSHAMNQMESKKVRVYVKRQEQPIEIDLVPDPEWPSDEMGLVFTPEKRLQKASGLADAVVMGLRETYEKIYQVYLSMRSVATGRVPFMKNAQGPIGIAVIGFNVAGQDFNAFLLFLGLININLAVVNFLPIPVLDGGHMVFLIYEKIRGKPASEQVRTYTTFAGLALILSLMLLVIFLDVKHHVFGL
jgi:membrane-associated protease RseP (regulator of RpoE activity)